MSSPIPNQAASDPPPQAPSSPPYPLAQVLLPIWPAPYLTTIFRQISPHLTHSNFKIYIQHFELFRRDLLTKDMFNTGVTTIYPIINTSVLENLHVLFLKDDTVLASIYAKEGFLRVVDAIDVAFSPYMQPGFDFILGAQQNFAGLVLATRNERRMNGLSLE